MRLSFMEAVASECGDVLRRHRLGRFVVSMLPDDNFHIARATCLRWFGWQLGHRVLLASTPRLLGTGALHRRLTVGPGVYVNTGAVWELGAEIHIGERVHIGQGVQLLTTTHEIGAPTCRAGAAVSTPINVGAGSWIAAGVTVLGGSTIGDGSIVAAGCVVRGNVPPNCLYGGVPGRVIRSLDEEVTSSPQETPERVAALV